MSEVKNIGNDIFESLKGAISLMGPIPQSSGALRSVINNTRSLNRVLSSFDRKASDLINSSPDKNEMKSELDKWIKERYPMSKGYTDKGYKRLFMRTIHRPMFLLKKKHKLKEEQKKASLEAIRLFKIVYNTVLAASRKAVDVSMAATSSSLDNTSDPSDFDEEMEGNTDALADALRGSPRIPDKNQEQTRIQLDRKTRSKSPGQVSNTTEYSELVRKYSQIPQDAASVIQKYKDTLKKSLASSDDETFTLIVRAAQQANQLAQSFNAAANSSKEGLFPGSYTTCTVFASLLKELGQVVVESASLNTKTRRDIDKKQKQYQKYLDDTATPDIKED